MEKKNEWEERYADLVLRSGINLQKGQKVQITVWATNYDFARTLATRAYQLGASYVNVSVKDNYLTRERILHSSVEELEYFTTAETVLSQEQASGDWAFLSIDGTAESDVLSGLEAEKLSQITQSKEVARKALRPHLMSDKLPWCVIAAPTTTWAKKVLGPEATKESLIELLTPILRLDHSDPVQAWKEHSQKLQQRSARLNALGLKEIRLRDSESDLTIGLVQEVLWKGGGSQLPNTRGFIPNIPTEEVYTLPDFSKTRGRVTVKKPVTVLGNLVEGAWFEFEAGVVVKHGAKKNQAALDAFLEIDEGARRLGELALVDRKSPIYQSNAIFSSILYDENAASHIALGNGYPSCLTKEALNSGKPVSEFGCNQSMMHTDFMIGSDDMEVTGVTYSGESVLLMKECLFTETIG